jgi:hypothetical protein
MRKSAKKRKKNHKHKAMKFWLITLFIMFCLVGTVMVFKAALVTFAPFLIQADNVFNNKDESEKAKALSDQIVSDIARNDYEDIYEHLDDSLKAATKNEKEIMDILSKIFDAYGRQAICIFKSEEVGIKIDSQGKRSVATFWYTYKTTKYPNNHYLKIDIVASAKDENLAVVGLTVNIFPNGAPPQWK